jgi:hypothetical protein
MSTTITQGIAAQIVAKAALDALELNAPLHASHVGCSFDAWLSGDTYKSAKLFEQFERQAQDVQAHLHALGFRW